MIDNRKNSPAAILAVPGCFLSTAEFPAAKCPGGGAEIQGNPPLTVSDWFSERL